MALTIPLPVTLEEFEQAAREYEASLTVEDIMENTRTATQRGILLETLGALRERDPRVEPFNELLVQFIHDGALRQIVPDNMFLVTLHPPVDRNSFNVPLEPVGPFMTLEYVSEGSHRKDYEVNLQRYYDLQVPYYLIFDPQHVVLELYRLSDDGYVRLEPDTSGRVSVPELDVQIGLLDGWVRFWHRGELLKLRSELSRVVKQQDAKLVEKDAKLVEKDAKLAEKDAKLVEKDAKLVEKDAKLVEKDAKLVEKDAKLAEKDVKLAEQAAELSNQQMANDQLVAVLRQAVEFRARQLGRRDVLDQLRETTEIARIQQWLVELT